MFSDNLASDIMKIIFFVMIVAMPSTALYFLITTGAVPKPLDDWALLCVGFIGSMATQFTQKA